MALMQGNPDAADRRLEGQEDPSNHSSGRVFAVNIFQRAAFTSLASYPPIFHGSRSAPGT